MLETLVASKIRRVLFEHLLTHQDGRFYLRGLAKELSVSVSPLRRELKRLEQTGLLKAYQEANIRFYVIDHTCPLFAQLKQAWLPPPVPVSEGLGGVPTDQPAQQPSVAATVISSPAIEQVPQTRRPRFAWPVLVGAMSFSVLMLLLLGTAMYLAMTNHQLMSLTARAIARPQSQLTVVEPDLSAVPTAQAGPAPSGAMHSSRWRLVPGAVGGFSQAASKESY